MRVLREPVRAACFAAPSFDAFVEDQCAAFYATRGRPSLVPGLYVRLLLIAGAGARQDGRHRCDHAGSQCRLAQHRAA
jgi:hypothetical protein